MGGIAKDAYLLQGTLLIAGAGNLLLTKHGLPYLVPDGWPGLTWIWSTGFALQHCFHRGLVGEGSAMAPPWHPAGKPLSGEPPAKVWVCKSQLLVIDFAQSSKGKN